MKRKYPVQMAGAYWNCRFCGGNGCIACPGERDKAAAKAEMPEPIFTARLDDDADMELANEVIGKDALDKAFGPGGGGVQEIEYNAAIASFKQYMRRAVTVEKEKEQKTDDQSPNQ